MIFRQGADQSRSLEAADAFHHTRANCEYQRDSGPIARRLNWRPACTRELRRRSARCGDVLLRGLAFPCPILLGTRHPASVGTRTGRLLPSPSGVRCADPIQNNWYVVRKQLRRPTQAAAHESDFDRMRGQQHE